MQVYPAIDLRAGNCVRLYQGDFANLTTYAADPAAVVAEFAGAGSRWVHLVDLDGAKQGQVMQTSLIADLVAQHNLKFEVGGGIRTSSDISKLLALGVARVVVGSMCVTNPRLVQEWLANFGPEQIVLALDCSLDTSGVARVRTHGWQQQSQLSVAEVLTHYPTAQHVLCTDVGVDGTLAGPSLELYRSLRHDFPHLDLIASGGVAKLADLHALRQLGVAGVVIGKALYEKQFSLADALAQCS